MTTYTNGKYAHGEVPIVIVHKDHRISPVGPCAGAETATIALARAFSRLGKRVYLAGILPPEFVTEVSKTSGTFLDGVTYIDLTPEYNTQLLFHQLEVIRGILLYDFIAVSKPLALLQTQYNPRVRSRIFITHEPTVMDFGLQPQTIANNVDRIVCVSAAQREKLIDAGCDINMVQIIPNGADLNIFTAGDPEKRNYLQLLFVGALVVDKGLHVLLETYAKLRAKFQNLRLDVYGSAQMWGRDDYLDLKTIAGKFPDINLHGAVAQEEVAAAMRSAGLLVAPSIFFDSFPLTVVEAQVSGLPVLGSKNGGMKEIIEDGVTGKLIDPITPEKLASEMERLLASPERLKEMSAACLRTMRSRYSWEQVADSVLGIIRDLGVHDNQANLTRPNPHHP